IVPFKLYQPGDTDGQPAPVIVWSHGFGGNRDGAAFLSRYLASCGYNILHLTHPGTDSSLWEGKPGHPWDILRATKIPREDALDRFRDVPFAVDSLAQWARDNPDTGPLLDLTRLGMSGHSFGALTTQVIAGQLVPDAAGELISLQDERFKAGILYSPVPVSHIANMPLESVYGSISIPLFHMTGTDDSSPLESFGYEYRLIVYEHTGHPEKYLLIKEGGDHMVYNGTRGKLEPNPLRERHEEIIRIASLAFWEAHLRGDPKAHEWLAHGGFQSYLHEDARFTGKF
ncbi:MAG: hypothetical protein K9G62_04975, partial [Alphaproteobacteria bacterium]|nr:hypothetical protein [Alphaproteobacteria bacterium]